MILLPLTYSVLLYLVSDNLVALAAITVTAIMIAAVVTALALSFNVAGTGANDSGTKIIFILMFGGAFYGFAVSGLFGNANNPNSIAGVFNDALFALGLAPAISGQYPNMAGASLMGGSALSVDYPYKPVVDIIFGIIYGLGLYLLTSD